MCQTIAEHLDCVFGLVADLTVPLMQRAGFDTVRHCPGELRLPLQAAHRDPSTAT